jgi:hypothetical protein
MNAVYDVVSMAYSLMDYLLVYKVSLSSILLSLSYYLSFPLY